MLVPRLEVIPPGWMVTWQDAQGRQIGELAGYWRTDVGIFANVSQQVAPGLTITYILEPERLSPILLF